MSSSYYDEDEDFDIHIRRGRAASPVYHEHRYQPPPPPPPPMAVGRPVYYTHGSNYLAEPSAPVRRSHSPSHRGSPERTAPVVINNIYNEYDDDDDDDRRYLQLARPVGRARSRSRSHTHTSPRSSRESYELEKTRKELEEFKLHVERDKEEKRIKKELELKRLRLEREAEEEKERIKRETATAIEKYKLGEAERAAKEAEMAAREKQERTMAIEKYKLEEAERAAKAAEMAAREKQERAMAIEKYKLEEAERAAKEKREKEEREKEYQARMREDLRKSGMTDRQIEDLLRKDKAVDTSRPTYTKMSRRHLSIETLNKYRIDYEFDVDPDYVLIKRWVPEHEQDILWAHTREIRERRQPVLLAIEATRKHGETELEFVRKKKHHERRHSPSPLITFLAGGRPR